MGRALGLAMSGDPPQTGAMSDPQPLQERIAHLERVIDDLSDVVARQDRQLADMTRRVATLIERQAARDAEATGGVVLGDERPPHY